MGPNPFRPHFVPSPATRSRFQGHNPSPYATGNDSKPAWEMLYVSTIRPFPAWLRGFSFSFVPFRPRKAGTGVPEGLESHYRGEKWR